MTMPRTIGYQEKTTKQSTAPIRNACPVRLSRTLRPRLVRCGLAEYGDGGRPGFLGVSGTVVIAKATPG